MKDQVDLNLKRIYVIIMYCVRLNEYMKNYWMKDGDEQIILLIVIMIKLLLIWSNIVGSSMYFTMK